MFLLGVDVGSDKPSAEFVLVERVRKNLRKYYHIIEVNRDLSIGDHAGVSEKITGVYNNIEYSVRKPRFSQNGRPKKIVHSKPIILIRLSNKEVDIADYVKQKKVPMECVLRGEGDEWIKETKGLCLGNNFYISQKVLFHCLLNVYRERRLIIDEKIPGVEVIAGFLKDMEKPENQIDGAPLPTEHAGLVFALSLPVWYYENLLSIRSKTS